MAEKSVNIILTPMTVAILAEKLNVTVNSLILMLLRQGIVSTRNQVLPEDLVEALAITHGAQVIKKETVAASGVADIKSSFVVGADNERRLPIVVVMGHVDHGKTTLLDFVRKTRVALKEKGGITQHLGAYQVPTDHGSIVFLDTPGHEAFSMIRARGAAVADIAILIVAADDGIMPQTLEALERARAASLPIIVAINKADKASEKQIEKTKTQLAQHDLTPEDWGGTTPCMLISALTGSGVSDLLDVVALQAHTMDLVADFKAPAVGYILETNMEKGRGSVATVICRNGTLKVGDSFVCGSTFGRINSLKDSQGKFVQEAPPSMPVQAAGFSELPRVGEILRVVKEKDIKKEMLAAGKATNALHSQVLEEGAIGLIIKTDNLSSQEALLNAIKKISLKTYKSLYVISAGIGALTETDIALAADTKSLVYGLHVKIESNAVALAQRLGIDIHRFDIIYKLLENLEELAQKGRPVKMKRKKIGEARVLKVFDIKKLGVIAGSAIIDGYFSRDGVVVVYRGKQKIGGGKITSLQREKNMVKEVRKGFECAFMVEKFEDWQVDDRVECYIDVPESE